MVKINRSPSACVRYNGGIWRETLIDVKAGAGDDLSAGVFADGEYSSDQIYAFATAGTGLPATMTIDIADISGTVLVAGAYTLVGGKLDSDYESARQKIAKAKSMVEGDVPNTILFKIKPATGAVNAVLVIKQLQSRD